MRLYVGYGDSGGAFGDIGRGSGEAGSEDVEAGFVIAAVRDKGGSELRADGRVEGS